MNSNSMQMRFRNFELDHELIEREQNSPYLSDMERYYLQKPAGFRGKIMMANWIPIGYRRHMVNHISARLALTTRRRAVPRTAIFGLFIRDPEATRFQTKFLSYEKTKKGRILKRSKKTGRFVRFEKKERAQLQEVKKHGN